MSDMEPALGPRGSIIEGENAPLYCICRKPDINCFMMYDQKEKHVLLRSELFPFCMLISIFSTDSGCDNCNEWFHGHCINITEKMAKAIREWYCMKCRGNNT